MEGIYGEAFPSEKILFFRSKAGEKTASKGTKGTVKK
jgi:hypothetical protein